MGEATIVLVCVCGWVFVVVAWIPLFDVKAQIHKQEWSDALFKECRKNIKPKQNITLLKGPLIWKLYFLCFLLN